MANWCSTAYAFYGPKKEIKRLHSRLNDVCKNDYSRTKYSSPNDFGPCWLGNALARHHILFSRTECRGSLYYVSDVACDSEHDFWTLIVETSTAWRPMPDMWDMILKKSYPSVKYVYEAEEPGNLLFLNTDTEGLFFPDKYLYACLLPVEDKPLKELTSGDDLEFEYFETRFSSDEELLLQLNEDFEIRFGKCFKSVEEYFAAEPEIQAELGRLGGECSVYTYEYSE